MQDTKATMQTLPSYRSRSRDAFCISSMTLNLNVSFPHLGGQHATHDDTCLAATVPALPGSWLPSDALLSPRTLSAHLQQLPSAVWAPSSKPQGGWPYEERFSNTPGDGSSLPCHTRYSDVLVK